MAEVEFRGKFCEVENNWWRRNGGDQLGVKVFEKVAGRNGPCGKPKALVTVIHNTA